MDKQALGPIDPRERIATLDVLRGFALLGVFVENIQRYVAEPTGGLDTLAARAVSYFAQGNFYPLYSILFGLGVAMQLARAGTGSLGTPLQLRRMGALLLIGIAFYLFLEDNSVFILFAIGGLALLPFVRASERTFLVAGLVVLMVSTVFPTLEDRLLDLRGQDEAAGVRRHIQVEREAFDRHLMMGTYGQIVADRASSLAFHLGVPSFYRWWIHIFAMLLLGMWAQRREIFMQPEQHLRLLRGLAWGGFAVAAVLLIAKRALVHQQGMLLPVLPWLDASSLRKGLSLLSGSAAAVAFSAFGTLLGCRAGPARVLSFLRGPGRLSLTNFVLQSVFMTFVFYPYGLGLFRKVGTTMGLVMVAAFYTAQVVGSTWWLGRFRLGPLEWLWRRITYARITP